MARSSPQSERGFIIVAVLWMLAALAALASVYSIYASNTAMASHVEDDRLQAEASLKAGVELAAAQLSAGQPAAQLPGAGQAPTQPPGAQATAQLTGGETPTRPTFGDF